MKFSVSLITLAVALASALPAPGHGGQAANADKTACSDKNLPTPQPQTKPQGGNGGQWNSNPWKNKHGGNWYNKPNHGGAWPGQPGQDGTPAAPSPSPAVPVPSPGAGDGQASTPPPNQGGNNEPAPGAGNGQVPPVEGSSGGAEVVVPPCTPGVDTPLNTGKKVHTVCVGGIDVLTYNPPFVRAAAGEIVRFQFLARAHSITESTFDKPCTKKDGGEDSEFQPNPDNLPNGPTFDITVQDDKPRWFYCKQGNHCSLGMVFAINPEKAANPPPVAPAVDNAKTYIKFLTNAVKTICEAPATPAPAPAPATPPAGGSGDNGAPVTTTPEQNGTPAQGDNSNVVEEEEDELLEEEGEGDKGSTTTTSKTTRY